MYGKVWEDWKESLEDGKLPLVTYVEAGWYSQEELKTFVERFDCLGSYKHLK